MKAVILAGGVGTRLSEETGVRPKPMVEIGGKPIVWHIMKIYSAHGINDFVIAAGYKSYILKEYFTSYFLRMAEDVTVDLAKNEITAHSSDAEPWRVTIVETGDNTMTGGRLKRVAPYLDGETFCMTYGDCLSDVDIGELVSFHREKGAVATVTAVQPPGRYGVLALADGVRIAAFFEKPDGERGWINGGFFVLEPSALDAIDGDESTWEREPLERLATEGDVAAFRHSGFWQPMDTLREQMVLEELWQSGEPPWKVW